jgi:sugar phosphate isomerase/epimerase
MNPLSITVSLVPEARGGPFILWDPLPESCRKAKAHGYDAIELFPPSAEGVDAGLLERSLREHGIRLAAVGTGAGWVLRKLSLTSPDPAVRRAARDFVLDVVDLAGRFGAPAILGSLQGRWGGGVSLALARSWIAEALEGFGARAERHGTTFLLEPLNRYEGNVLNTLAEAAGLIRGLRSPAVRILADFFHMNIEETDLCGALRDAGTLLGHVQLADSNRRPAGHGHTDFRAVAAQLRAMGYAGALSAEALPWPDPDAAAKLAIEGIRRIFA